MPILVHKQSYNRTIYLLKELFPPANSDVPTTPWRGLRLSALRSTLSPARIVEDGPLSVDNLPLKVDRTGFFMFHVARLAKRIRYVLESWRLSGDSSLRYSEKIVDIPSPITP